MARSLSPSSTSTVQKLQPEPGFRRGFLEKAQSHRLALLLRRRKVLLWWLCGLLVLIMVGVALVLGLVFGLAQRSRAHPAPGRNVNLTVDLGYSVYEGVNESGNNTGVSHWFGIRYAAPPLENLRFRAPQDPLVNTTLQQADTQGPLCHPTPTTALDNITSEDCLFLNVWAPTKSDGLKPVFVLFQGGGFNTLSDGDKNGTVLVEAGDHGLVVVTFNYRVGPWGFLTSKEVQENGDLNVGLLDQRKLLHWVQSYIHLFGGDPNHVTIGGGSAGGASVDLHLSAFGGRDDGLFHAAAAESQSFGAQLTVSESQYQYDALVSRVNCSAAADTLQCLRETDIAVIAKNNINIPTPGGAGGTPVFMYSNVIDGSFTPDYTYNLYTEGKFVRVPVIFGDVTNEGTIFTPAAINNLSDFNDFLKDNWVKLNASELATIDVFWPEAQQFPNVGAYWRAAANAYGEMRYNCPGIYLSSTFPRFGVPQSWNYHWDYLQAANAASGLGVVHVAEEAVIWGESPTNPWTATIQAYWTSFIRTKDPNTLKLRQAPAWTTFDAQSMQRIHFANDGVAMESVPADQKARCAFASSIGGMLGQ